MFWCIISEEKKTKKTFIFSWTSIPRNLAPLQNNLQENNLQIFMLQKINRARTSNWRINDVVKKAILCDFILSSVNHC